ncbi:hypothetical protein LWC34_23590 [Kibdelosporangium philippinense]|uniref:Excreted virulence factor EspC, type VII ESX diderm n=1 Tax=Kibdelosporangium philippinense TaxID=211113 RepID=A0ABS8ZFD6_9PSEU|nr:hypothetical protein [Kibdelosporangium philippinense]MCE7005788.1 hypothetical protein [Kibdelosporangium philippinense]
MPEGKADVKMNPEELKLLVPRLEDLSIGLTRLVTHIKNAKVQANHFGQTNNAAAAGNFVKQSLDTLSASVTTGQQYAASLVTALQQSVGMTTQTEQQNKQSFKNQAEAV